MLTLYKARSVITMNPSMPRASAVLVRDGNILEVGEPERMQPWLEGQQFTVDEQFADKIICPGFIDPHLHPSMAAVILPMEFITAMRWKLPWGDVEPVTDPAAFDARMQALHRSKPAEEPLFIWGYHQLWHGEMDKARIQQVSDQRPIIVWHRSFHELYMNDPAMSMAGIDPAQIKPGLQIDIDQGHFFEVGLGFAINRLNPWILAPEKYAEGLRRLKQVVHHGGHTSIGDLATGMFNLDAEAKALTEQLEGDDVPFRTRLVVHGTRLTHGGRKPEEGPAMAADLLRHNSHRLSFGRHIKLFSDGAFFSQLAQMQEPGYIDGHHGEWLAAPEELERHIRAYWHAGYQIHVHVTGDLGLELTLDILQKMQEEKPRFSHGFTFEHFGFSTPEQIRRIKALGAQVSANVYYLHELSDSYAKSGIGYERASQMARIGSCFAAGINTTVHSDFTMAPAEPLNSIWVAVNRMNHRGQVMGAAEKLTQQQALEAITINAAHTIGMADITGSLRAGKRADFTVLDDDPLNCDPMALRDIGIHATVFEGRVFPIP
ncbi:MAG: amidohydrolase [Pseudomonadota bacterium]|nr:amidohydrolase [Pseudomonadota bacterium]MEC8620073.1 amidohydrolase [Pseudomonadota bacterium]